MLIAFCIGLAVIATGALLLGRVVVLRGMREAEKNESRPFDD